MNYRVNLAFSAWVSQNSNTRGHWFHILPSFSKCLTEVFSVSHTEPDKLCSLTAPACFQKEEPSKTVGQKVGKKRSWKTHLHPHKFAWDPSSYLQSQCVTCTCQQKFFTSSKSCGCFSFEKIPYATIKWAKMRFGVFSSLCMHTHESSQTALLHLWVCVR